MYVAVFKDNRWNAPQRLYAFALDEELCSTIEEARRDANEFAKSSPWNLEVVGVFEAECDVSNVMDWEFL